MYQGIKNEMPGIRRAISMNRAVFFMLFLATAYAAGRPSTRDIPTEATATIVEFFMYLRKCWLTNTSLKFFNVGLNVNFGGHAMISTWTLKAEMSIQYRGKTITAQTNRTAR